MFIDSLLGVRVYGEFRVCVGEYRRYCFVFKGCFFILYFFSKCYVRVGLWLIWVRFCFRGILVGCILIGVMVSRDCVGSYFF